MTQTYHDSREMLSHFFILQVYLKSLNNEFNKLALLHYSIKIDIDIDIDIDISINIKKLLNYG